MDHWLLILFVLIGLVFDFLNGFHDSANVVATAIASRAVPPRWALGVNAIANFAGPLLFGVAVATTIGNEVVTETAVTVPVALAALIAAIFWNVLTWLLGIPSSSSHALIGGFVGAAIAGYGLEVIRIEGLIKVLVGLFISPILGMIIGWMIMRVVLFFGQAMTPRVSIFFQRAQWLTMITLGLSHGSNDAQKTMGILAMGLLAFGAIPRFYVPFWVILACAASIALGSALGGWRLIRTMGGRFYKIRPRHALCSQVASTAVILGAALLGGPVSSTQVISSTIVGVGAAERMPMVRWGVVGQIIMAWLLTIPATCAVGAMIFWVIHTIL